jgi:hypothetical protein
MRSRLHTKPIRASWRSAMPSRCALAASGRSGWCPFRQPRQSRGDRVDRRRRHAIQAGGGVRGEDDLQRLFDAGVSRVVLGSVAIRDPERSRAG